MIEEVFEAQSMGDVAGYPSEEGDPSEHVVGSLAVVVLAVLELGMQ